MEPVSTGVLEPSEGNQPPAAPAPPPAPGPATADVISNQTRCKLCRRLLLDGETTECIPICAAGWRREIWHTTLTSQT